MESIRIPKSLYLVLAILMITIGVIVFLENKAPAENKGAVPTITKPTASTSTNPTSEIDTSDWQIYRNEEYGFEINYPSEFNFEISTPVGIKTITFADRSEPISLHHLQYKVVDSISVYPSPTLSDEEMASLKAQYTRWPKVETVEIGTYSALKFVPATQDDLTVFIIRHGEIMLEIAMYPGPKHIDISSLQFTR